MKAINGYLENGQFTPFEGVSLPKRVQAVLVFNEIEANSAKDLNQHAQSWKKFLKEIKECDEQLGEEFDLTMNKRVNFTRELDL